MSAFQSPLFDLPSPYLHKPGIYLRGYSHEVVALLPRFDAWLATEPPSKLVSIAPDRLYPTQRTVHPRIVAYYHQTQRLKDTQGQYPLVVYYAARHWIVNGHHRWAAFFDRPRLRVRVYEFVE